MPHKVINLDNIRRANQLLDKASNVNPNVKQRFQSLINDDETLISELKPDNKVPTMKKEPDTQVISVRIKNDLLEFIDRYNRIASANDDESFTRNSIINQFLETMKGIIERQEREFWGKSHLEMIQDAINDARRLNEDNDDA